MKKILALMLALTIAAVSLFALGVTAFADPAEGENPSSSDVAPDAGADTDTDTAEPSTNGQTPDDPDLTTTQAPATQAPTDAPSTHPPTEAPSTEPSTAPLLTLAPDATNNINDPDENGTTVPAPVDTDIPNTGSGIVVPALALLALAGGAVIAVKAKKED